MDPLTIYINCARIIARRDWERDKLNMPLEIKGLGGLVSEVRKGIADVRVVAAEVNEAGRGLAGDLRDLKKQITGAREDIKFEAQTMGNSQTPEEKLTPPSQNGAASGAGERSGGAPPDPSLPSPERASGDGAVNHLDRNGVNKG